MDHLVRQFEVEAVEAALRFAIFADAGEVFRLGSVDQTLSLWVTSRNHKVESLRVEIAFCPFHWTLISTSPKS